MAKIRDFNHQWAPGIAFGIPMVKHPHNLGYHNYGHGLLIKRELHLQAGIVYPNMCSETAWMYIYDI